MVHDHLWRQAYKKRRGMLCIGCLETRLGRYLTPDDFTDAPVNQGFFIFSLRLLDRLGGLDI